MADSTQNNKILFPVMLLPNVLHIMNELETLFRLSRINRRNIIHNITKNNT